MDKYQNTNYNNIKFSEIESGGELNDSNKDFLDQKNIIKSSNTEYMENLEYNNKLKRDKDENNDKYYEKKNESLTNSNYRVNNAPTIIDQFNISNPIIYPDTYDSYFEYLSKKKY